MKDIAIFGFKDSSTGQLINMLDDKLRRKLNCIIGINKITKKTEFILNNKIYGLPVFQEKNFVKTFKERKIKKVFVIEDSGNKEVIFSSN